MKKKTPPFLLIIFYIILFFANCKQIVKEDSPAQLHRVPIQSKVDGKERDFFLYLPKGYESEPNKIFPVMMFLHGNGERGNGKEQLDYTMIHGPLYEAWIQKRNLPFIILVPQLPFFGMDKKGLDYIDNRDPSIIPQRLENETPSREAKWKMDSPMLGAIQSDTFPNGLITLPVGWDKCDEDLMTIFDLVFKKYRADQSRVYLTGLSYGGFGTWWMASKHPELFAAINPVVGWGHPDLMAPIAAHKIPVWAVAGGRDQVIPARYFYQGLNKLEELGHPDVRFTIEADMGHDTWKRLYEGEDIYNWFLEHRKRD